MNSEYAMSTTAADDRIDLAEATAAARRRVSAARGLLTRARRSGDAEAVSAARQALRERSAAYTRLLRAAVTAGTRI